MLVQELHAAVERVAPIHGVRVGRKDDRATWSIDFQSTATAEQIAAANTVLANFDPTTPEVPQSVTPYQARVALSNAGLRTQTETAISNSDQSVRDAWEYGTTVERDSPFILGISTILGLTDAEVDALFIAAGQIT